MGDAIDRFLELGARKECDTHKVFVLSAPDDPGTVRLARQDSRTALGERMPQIISTCFL
jgi:hypothetical protein